MSSLDTDDRTSDTSVAGGPVERRGLIGLLGAVGTSQLGTRMSFLAVPWLVLVMTGSASTAGAVAFAELLPYVTVQAVGGPLVDRVGARRTAVLCDCCAAVSMGAIPVIGAFGDIRIWVLAALVALTGFLRGAGDAARDVLVPGVTELAGAPMERGAGLYDGVSRLASLIGAPVAGVLVAVAACCWRSH